jgi:hypothetical protein
LLAAAFRRQVAIIADEGMAACRRSACSTTGCRPATTAKERLSSTFGRQ